MGGIIDEVICIKIDLTTKFMFKIPPCSVTYIDLSTFVVGQGKCFSSRHIEFEIL